MCKPPTAFRLPRTSRSTISSAGDRSWLSFSSLASPKPDRHAVMAAHSTSDHEGDQDQEYDDPLIADVIDTPRPALTGRQTWLVLQNIDRKFFREHGEAIAKGTLKLGVPHEKGYFEVLGRRVTLGRWPRVVWFEEECAHFKDPIADGPACEGAGPCALDLCEYVRVDREAFDRIPGPVKRVLGYYKYVPKATS